MMIQRLVHLKEHKIVNLKEHLDSNGGSRSTKTSLQDPFHRQKLHAHILSQWAKGC